MTERTLPWDYAARRKEARQWVIFSYEAGGVRHVWAHVTGNEERADQEARRLAIANPMIEFFYDPE